MQLKEELTLIQRGTRSITEYLHVVDALVDEIAIIDHPISDDDLTLYVLNGLGPDFREIAAPIRARELSLAFEELHDLLVGHDAYLRCLEAATQQLVVSANFTKTKHSTPEESQSWSFKKHDSARGPLGSNLSRNFNGAQREGRCFNLCYFLVYIDDLVITRNNSILVANIIKQLCDMFSLKDMDSLHFFLGIEVIPTRAGLFLSQHKYVRVLLANTSMSGAKDVSTPLSTTQSLQLIDGTTAVHSFEFLIIISRLQYLSLTRPDISFAVNKLSQFMHKPTTNHWTATKRLLCYLKQTIFHGIQIHTATLPILRTYSDADWAGNVDDRTSTPAYIIFLGPNPNSCSSKKQ